MPPSPTQLVWRGRIEAVLRVAAPGLDLLLAAGDRLARAVEPEPTGGALPARSAERLPAGRPAEQLPARAGGPAGGPFSSDSA